MIHCRSQLIKCRKIAEKCANHNNIFYGIVISQDNMYFIKIAKENHGGVSYIMNE